MGSTWVGHIKRHPKKILLLLSLSLAYFFCLPKAAFQKAHGNGC